MPGLRVSGQMPDIGQARGFTVEGHEFPRPGAPGGSGDHQIGKAKTLEYPS